MFEYERIESNEWYRFIPIIIIFCRLDVDITRIRLFMTTMSQVIYMRTRVRNPV